ncbi:MAG: hypothetical protein RIC55_02405 [Pirellulaceae bacterium]
MPRCEHCRFFHAHPPASSPGEIVVSGDGIRGGGECRANAPIILPEQIMACFPVVWNDGWCGRFEPVAALPPAQCG